MEALPRALAANVVMAALLWWVAGSWHAWLAMSPFERSWHMALCIGGGALAYFGVLLGLGVRYRDFRAT